MDVLFASRPAYGHLHPLIPLAMALHQAGHRVSFATGGDFVPRLEGWGFSAVPVGESIAWAAERVPALLKTRPLQVEPGLDFATTLFVDVLGRRSLEDASVLIADERPDLVIYEATDVGVAVAAAAAGVAVACHALSLWHPPYQDAMRERAELLWSLAGTSCTVDVTRGDALLDLWPASLGDADGAVRAVPNRWPIRPVAWNDPSAPVPTLDALGRPLVFVSLGTMYQGVSFSGRSPPRSDAWTSARSSSRERARRLRNFSRRASGFMLLRS